MDHVIVVAAPAFIQRQRVLARPGMTEARNSNGILGPSDARSPKSANAPTSSCARVWTKAAPSEQLGKIVAVLSRRDIKAATWPPRPRRPAALTVQRRAGPPARSPRKPLWPPNARSFSTPRPPASSPNSGHRIVEVGCVELDRTIMPSGQTASTRYVNPDRDDARAGRFKPSTGSPISFLASSTRYLRRSRRNSWSSSWVTLRWSSTMRPSTWASSIRRTRAAGAGRLLERTRSGHRHHAEIRTPGNILAPRPASMRCAVVLSIDNSRAHRKHGALLDAELAGGGLSRADRARASRDCHWPYRSTSSGDSGLAERQVRIGRVSRARTPRLKPSWRLRRRFLETIP